MNPAGKAEPKWATAACLSGELRGAIHGKKVASLFFDNVDASMKGNERG
ncbi:MAG: hypothetical protein ACYDHE_22105 [Candidatus Acidiferrales bacterium]